MKKLPWNGIGSRLKLRTKGLVEEFAIERMFIMHAAGVVCIGAKARWCSHPWIVHQNRWGRGGRGRRRVFMSYLQETLCTCKDALMSRAWTTFWKLLEEARALKALHRPRGRQESSRKTAGDVGPWWAFYRPSRHQITIARRDRLIYSSRMQPLFIARFPSNLWIWWKTDIVTYHIHQTVPVYPQSLTVGLIIKAQCWWING